MAMGRCRECKKKVSSEAETCPNCGVASPVEAPRKSGATDAIAVVVLSALVIWIVVQCQDAGQIAQGPKSEQPDAALQTHLSAWDGEHRQVADAIRKRMNDPGSYDHVETKVFDTGEGYTLTTTVRGTNAFGAVVTNTYQARLDDSGKLVRLFQ